MSNFELYPAVDLKQGKCVRLLRGDMAQSTVFSDSPAAQAKAFAEAGFSWLHVVDLDGAFAGEPMNAPAIDGILQVSRLKVQLGGGIRNLETIRYWLEKGISRVILGTVALRDPALVKQACREFAGHIAVGIDARDGKVAVEGWAETSDMPAVELAKCYADAGVSAIIYTDISRDGAMQGANVTGTAEFARAHSIPVILSGGVTTLEDIRAARAEQKSGIAGAIIGRALYEKTIDPLEALATVGG